MRMARGEWVREAKRMRKDQTNNMCKYWCKTYIICFLCTMCHLWFNMRDIRYPLYVLCVCVYCAMRQSVSDSAPSPLIWLCVLLYSWLCTQFSIFFFGVPFDFVCVYLVAQSESLARDLDRVAIVAVAFVAVERRIVVVSDFCTRVCYRIFRFQLVWENSIYFSQQQ